jgi:hypothetical protein
MTKTCLECGSEKDSGEFNFRNRAKGTRNGRCRLCTQELGKQRYRKNPKPWIQKAKKRNKEAREETKRLLVEYLLKHPCVDCDESDIVVLDFDHVRGEKRENVTRMAQIGYSWKTILREIEKCVVRCANCHRRKTAKENRFFRTLIDISSGMFVAIQRN